MKIDFFLFANEKWDFIKSNHVRETPSESKLLVHTFKFNCPIFLYLNEKKGGKNNIFDMNTKNASTKSRQDKKCSHLSILDWSDDSALIYWTCDAYKFFFVYSDNFLLFICHGHNNDQQLVRRSWHYKLNFRKIFFFQLRFLCLPNTKPYLLLFFIFKIQRHADIVLFCWFKACTSTHFTCFGIFMCRRCNQRAFFRFNLYTY